MKTIQSVASWICNNQSWLLLVGLALVVARLSTAPSQLDYVVAAGVFGLWLTCVLSVTLVSMRTSKSEEYLLELTVPTLVYWLFFSVLAAFHETLRSFVSWALPSGLFWLGILYRWKVYGWGMYRRPPTKI